MAIFPPRAVGEKLHTYSLRCLLETLRLNRCITVVIRSFFPCVSLHYLPSVHVCSSTPFSSFDQYHSHLELQPTVMILCSALILVTFLVSGKKYQIPLEGTEVYFALHLKFVVRWLPVRDGGGILLPSCLPGSKESRKEPDREIHPFRVYS